MPPKGDLQLSIGYWIVSHRQTLRTWWGIMLLAVIISSFLWMIIFFSIYFGQEKNITAKMVSTINGLSSLTSSRLKPQAITTSPVTVIIRDDKHVDLVAEIINPNTDWAADAITVHFILNGVAQKPLHLFINQGDRRPVMHVLLSTTNTATATASLVIDDVVWARDSAAILPPPSFAVAEIEVTPSTVTLNGQTQSSFTVGAKITNNSVYNFYRTDVAIEFLNGDRIVGVGQVSLDRWPTLLTRPVSFTLPYPVALVTSAKIYPQVSRYDAGNIYR